MYYRRQKMNDDFMEIGDSHLVPQKDGWFLNMKTKELYDPEGRIYNGEFDLVYDPTEDDA